MSRLSVICLTIALLAGCNARDTASLGNGAYTEGGYGSAFYAEVPYAAEEGAKTRVYLFGTLAGFDAFMATKQVEDKKHKKVFGNGQTLVVELIAGTLAKEDPTFSDRLIAHYKARHPVAPEPVAEVTPVPATAPATEPAAAPAK